MQYRFQSAGVIYQVSFEEGGPEFEALIDGISYHVAILDEKPGQISLLFNGRPTVIYWAVDNGRKWICLEGCTYMLEKPATQTVHKSREIAGEEILRAPMPAQVRAVQTATGAWLEKGQTLVILEAMKMEIRIQAPRDGRVVRVLVNEGQTVDRNQVLAEMRPE